MDETRNWSVVSDVLHDACAVRRAVRSFLEASADPARSDLDAAELIVGELVANVVVHGGPPFGVCVDWNDDVPMLYVSDRGTRAQAADLSRARPTSRARPRPALGARARERRAGRHRTAQRRTHGYARRGRVARVPESGCRAERVGRAAASPYAPPVSGVPSWRRSSCGPAQPISWPARPISSPPAQPCAQATSSPPSSLRRTSWRRAWRSDGLLEAASGDELEDAFGGNVDRLAGLRVPGDARGPVPNLELTEGRQLHLVAGSEHLGDPVEHRFDQLGDLPSRKFEIVGKLSRQLVFGHGFLSCGSARHEPHRPPIYAEKSIFPAVS